MNIHELLAALQTNAERAHKPMAVELDGIGTVYIRRRTVEEFEDLAKVKEGEPSGKFGPALARLICDENGDRLPEEHRDRLAQLLSQQPDTVFHKLISVADGSAEVEKAAAPGN